MTGNHFKGNQVTLILMAERCVFCRIVSRELPTHVVYESEGALALLDINPSAPGHTLVVPRAHASRIEDLSDSDAAALFGALHRVVGPVQEAVGASASTIGVNNGGESGQEVPHVHIHVIPRRKGDGGGIILGISKSPRGKGEFGVIAESIKQRISSG